MTHQSSLTPQLSSPGLLRGVSSGITLRSVSQGLRNRSDIGPRYGSGSYVGFWIAICLALIIMPLGGLLCGVQSATAEVSAVSTSAVGEVQKTIDEVVEIAQRYSGKEQMKLRREKLREVINPRFDFEEMAKRSMGANWMQISPDQQNQFREVFSELLARTYLSKIETVKPGMVKMDGEKLDLPRSLVRTLVTSKGDVFPIEYRLYKQDGGWKVYDVIIENIGLVANYRNEFAGIMRKDGFDGLLQRLKDKNAAASKDT
ncbi:MAG: ABC transporter substrate-binding protein [Proteobacteria bacterium]|nr:ABC transporter substrate-binding protein [Pseudomonadota bacterium]